MDIRAKKHQLTIAEMPRCLHYVSEYAKQSRSNINHMLTISEMPGPDHKYYVVGKSGIHSTDIYTRLGGGAAIITGEHQPNNNNVWSPKFNL